MGEELNIEEILDINALEPMKFLDKIQNMVQGQKLIFIIVLRASYRQVNTMFLC